MKKNVQEKALKWSLTDETSPSSRAMLLAFIGIELEEYDVPLSSEDFARCLGLLEAVPEFKAQMSKIKDVSPQWKKLVEHWSELEANYNFMLNSEDLSPINLFYDLLEECIQ